MTNKSSLENITQFLKGLSSTGYEEKLFRVKEFQKSVSEDETIVDETLNEMLSSLAYDLSFYEPDSDKRQEDSSYFGDERLQELVNDGLAEITRYAEKLNLR